MASTSAAGTSDGIVLTSRKREPYVSLSCPYPTCRASIEYLPPSGAQLAALPSSETSFKVTCCTCGKNFEPPGAPRMVREAKGNGGKAIEGARKRRIGTDERPLDMT